MDVLLPVLLALLLILGLLYKKIPIGLAILAGGLLIWALRSPEPQQLVQAATAVLRSRRTYNLELALYLVMCLEVELRTSGMLSGMVRALQRMFRSGRATLAVMPAFLGLLPSLGGARFSAPIVAEAARDLNLTPAHKSAINFWFRHIFEFSNPIVPGLILACSIANVTYGALLTHLAWVTPLAFCLGWMLLIRPISIYPAYAEHDLHAETPRQDWLAVLLSLYPVVLSFCLAVFADMDAALAMLCAVLTLIPMVKGMGLPLSIRQVFVDAVDVKMILNVLCILCFIELLQVTGTLAGIVTAFQQSPLPVPVIVAGLSFVVGFLTGMSQGLVAMALPIAVAMAPGNVYMLGLVMVFGLAGHNLTPTHMCLLVTLDYFSADVFETLRPILLLELLMMAVYGAFVWVMW